MLRSTTLLLLPGILMGCQTPTPGSTSRVEPAPRRAAEPVRSLDRSLDCLRQEFNAHAERPRLVTFLSPSRAPATGALKAVLDELPEDDFHVSVIWVSELAEDTPALARRVGLELDDPRVSFFHDGRHRAGHAFARGFLPIGTVRDVYLFYPCGAQWEEEPPQPVTWTHQLGCLFPDTFASEEELDHVLRTSMVALLGQ